MPEVRGQNVESMVREFLADMFGMYEVKIERVHRLGRVNFQNRNPRPIIVRFGYYADRERVWGDRRSLIGSKLFLDEDFSQEIQSTRRKLFPVMSEAKRKGHRCELIKDKLLINGKLHSIDMLKSLPKEIRDGSRWGNEQVAFFGELCPASNFHRAAFEHDGIKYENSEKALFYKQAVKFGDNETAAKILKESDPRVIKRISKSIRNIDETAWNNSIKELITPILIDKFEQNQDLLEWLRSTERRRLVEAAGPHDKVWGNGLRLSSPQLHIFSSWTGENKQGEMLEEVRKTLCPELYASRVNESDKMDTHGGVVNTEDPFPASSQIVESQGFSPGKSPNRIK